MQEGNPLLSEIHIQTNELSNEKRFTIIEGIYNKFLQDDPLWHFFYEEEMGDIIRCSPEYRKDIEKFLIDCGFSFKSNETWIETIPEVVNNPEYFAEIFHINSEFIINKALKFRPESKRDGMVCFVDRYSHSLFINNLLLETPTFSEGSILSYAAMDRAFYEGIRYQYIRAKKYQEGLNKDGTKN